MIRILLVSLFTLALSSANAFAQNIYDACPAPVEAELDTTAHSHGSTAGQCDIYARQFAYREEDLKQRALIDERRENYGRPHLEAKKRQAEEWEKINATRSSENF